MQTEGVRDKKRRETRRRIIDEAGTLVQAKGFDNVTVDDICAAADISRRTFFNYMDSKDEAVLGVFPFVFTPESLERISTTQSDNLVELIISSICVVEDAYGPSPATRHQLLEANPCLLHAEATRKREMLTDLGRAVVDHLERFPDDRKLDGTVQEEAHIVIGMFRTVLSRYLWSPPSESDPIEGLTHRAHDITTYVKELQWQTLQ